MGSAAPVIEILDSDEESDDDEVVCLDDYVFTDDDEEEADDPGTGSDDPHHQRAADSDSDVEWEVEIVSVRDAPHPPTIDLTADDDDDDDEGEDDDGAPPPSHPRTRQQWRQQYQQQQQQQHYQQQQQQYRQQQQQQYRRQQQQQQQQQQPHQHQHHHQPPPPPPPVLSLFCDGSHRPRLQDPLKMSAGVWAASHKALCAAWLLHGGPPDSTRAELGAVFVAAVRLKTTLQADMLRQQPSAVHILTDCKACVQYLRPDAAVKAKYAPLVAAIRDRLQELRRLLGGSTPLLVRWVKGHRKDQSAEAIGNNAAHKLAKHCTVYSTVCQLPTRAA